MPASSSSKVRALVMPMDEPMLAGFTNSGRPSSSMVACRARSLRSASRHARYRGCGMPAAPVTCLAMALSIATAEPSTPLPT